MNQDHDQDKEDGDLSHTQQFKKTFSTQLRKLKLEEIRKRQKIMHDITWLEKHLHCSLGMLSKKYRDWIYNSKGFLTKENGYLDYNEWHVTAWSTILAVATFTLHEIFAALYILISIRVLRDKYSESSSLHEIDMELPYWFGFFIATSLILQHMGYTADFTVLLKLLPLLGL